MGRKLMSYVGLIIFIHTSSMWAGCKHASWSLKFILFRPPVPCPSISSLSPILSPFSLKPVRLISLTSASSLFLFLSAQIFFSPLPHILHAESCPLPRSRSITQPAGGIFECAAMPIIREQGLLLGFIEFTLPAVVLAPWDVLPLEWRKGRGKERSSLVRSGSALEGREGGCKGGSFMTNVAGSVTFTDVGRRGHGRKGLGVRMGCGEGRGGGGRRRRGKRGMRCERSRSAVGKRDRKRRRRRRRRRRVRRR